MDHNEVTVIVHEKVIFENATVMVTGHAFFDCTFRGCTLVFRDVAPMVFTGCQFASCAVELNMVIFDRGRWEVFQNDIATIVSGVLPAVRPSRGDQSYPPK